MFYRCGLCYRYLRIQIKCIINLDIFENVYFETLTMCVFYHITVNIVGSHLVLDIKSGKQTQVVTLHYYSKREEVWLLRVGGTEI